jgi:thioredoxin 1
MFVYELLEPYSNAAIHSMPTFLVFKNGKVVDTIRGANPSALRSAVSRAAADAGKGAASSGEHFQSQGYKLGAQGSSRAGARAGGAGWSLPSGGVGGLADSMVRFGGLYLTTLFSFDAYAAAQSSPFSVRNAAGR